eukprot:6975177-Alexandrium_andersonii.AAC.1
MNDSYDAPALGQPGSRPIGAPPGAAQSGELPQPPQIDEGPRRRARSQQRHRPTSKGRRQQGPDGGAAIDRI